MRGSFCNTTSTHLACCLLPNFTTTALSTFHTVHASSAPGQHSKRHTLHLHSRQLFVTSGMYGFCFPRFSFLASLFLALRAALPCPARLVGPKRPRPNSFVPRPLRAPRLSDEHDRRDGVRFLLRVRATG